jgi:two-component system catabolic regulation response regulator CreB
LTERHALIFEDDPKLGEIFLLALEQAGFTVDLDQRGNNFQARLNGEPPALIILDIHLPYASGIEIFEKIRYHETWADAMVIVTTADLYLAKSLEGKADYVLIKPVSVARLIGIVSKKWPDLKLSER